MRKIKTGFAFHVHHDRLMEFCHDYDERVKSIKENKPKDEQELRLRLFKLIPHDMLPTKGLDAHDKARDAYFKAWYAHDKAWDAWYKAWDAYLETNKTKIEKLHTELCPNCPWNGETIFATGVL